MDRIFFRITPKPGNTQFTEWFASSMLVKASPEAQCKFVQKQADKHGLGVTYTLATETEYWAYRARVQVEIAAARGDFKVDAEQTGDFDRAQSPRSAA